MENPYEWTLKENIKNSDENFLKMSIELMLKQSGFNICKRVQYNFPEQGATVVWILSESHAVISTYPEYNESIIHLASCNLEYFERFKKLFNEGIWSN